MLAFLEKIAIAYSFVTLFAIELLYQTALALYKGTRYSFITLKKTIISTFFELVSDVVMLIIDIVQALIDGVSKGWHSALITSHQFRQDAHH